jgi:hypothetical protein
MVAGPAGSQGETDAPNLDRIQVAESEPGERTMTKATTLLVASLALLAFVAASALAVSGGMVDVHAAGDGQISGSVALDGPDGADVCDITSLDVLVDGASVLDDPVADPAGHFGWDCAPTADWGVDWDGDAGDVTAEVVVESEAGSASQTVRHGS